MNVPIEQCTSAACYKPAPVRRYAFAALLVALYAWSLPFCYNTVGEPRAAAILRYQRLDDEKWATQSMQQVNSTSDPYEYLDEATDMDLSGGLGDFLNEGSSGGGGGSSSGSDSDGGGRGVLDSVEVDEFGNIVDIGAASTDVRVLKDAGSVSGKGSGFYGFFVSDESKAAKKRAKEESEQWTSQFKEAAGDEVILPPTYLPSAWACLAILVTLSLHALFFLLCRWSVKFKAWSMYAPTRQVDEHTWVLVTPPANRGKPELVQLHRAVLGKDLKLDFQRQSYRYLSAGQLRDLTTTATANATTTIVGASAASASKFANGLFQLTKCPVSLPLHFYTGASGLSGESLEVLQERWGTNHVSITLPGFLEMLQTQLLSPLAIFQVFCAILWLLDEYWTYTLWTLCSVVIFEAVTVFQRSKTQKMLGGMAPKPMPVFVYRGGEWLLLTSKELLPGDLVSISSAAAATAAGAGDDDSPTTAATTTAAATTAPSATAAKAASSRKATKDITIPCDCLLVAGSCIVNEASLTGESVPQMKETSDTSAIKLDMNGLHRTSVLFSGTSLIAFKGSAHTPSVGAGDAVGDAKPVPLAPDGGAVAYVLRTGFSSSQGALMQMIEFSQQTVSGDAYETGLALLMLLVFALIASGYVLREGLRKDEKTTHEILLRCVIIITSVVPRQLPMQMAMAVNMALMAMMKTGIFCTEPFRVPIAGKISHCLFDKTGTLTTDQLVPVGVVPVGSDAFKSADEVSVLHDTTAPEVSPLCALDSDNGVATAVLAACHSVVAGQDGKEELAGDPIEVAALKGICWRYDPESDTATPGDDRALQRQLEATVKLEAARERALVRFRRGDFADPVDPAAAAVGPPLPPPPPKTAAQKQHLLKTTTDQLTVLQRKLSRLRDGISNMQERKQRDSVVCSKAVIETRHHFSSHLGRMCVVAQCTGTMGCSGGEGSGDTSGLFAMVKGSPEALEPLIAPTSLPANYSNCYSRLAKKGLRVLALAYRPLSPAEATAHATGKLARESVECDLIFAGLIAFECKVRTDSGIVIQSLKESGHQVAMLTGDAALTSIHVARVTKICHPTRAVAVLTLLTPTPQAGSRKFVWTIESESDRRREPAAGEPSVPSSVPFDRDCIPTLALSYDLATTEATFLQLAGPLPDDTSTSTSTSTSASASSGTDPDMWKFIGFFKVMARMSPGGKADVIRALHAVDRNNNVLMCGDGGNDVGALKAAAVGVALLAGHANTNTSTDTGLEVPVFDAPAATAATADGAGGAGDKPTSVGHPTGAPAMAAEDLLNAHDKSIQRRKAEAEKLRKVHMKGFQERYMKKQQEELQKEMADLTAKGEYMKIFTAMKEQAGKTKRAIHLENARFMALHGQVWDAKDSTDEEQQDGLMGMLSGLDGSSGDGGAGADGGAAGAAAGQLPMIRPGDASVAAPFTSRVPSIRAVVDLIRQGRCTLLSALMQQQIMMLESCIAAYTLSALTLNNARSSERQMMASSWLIMTAAVAFSYASPVDRMHPQRPLNSLFHPSIIFSTLGQAAIHIACMTLAVQWATDEMGEEKLKEVGEFFKKAKLKQLDSESLCDEDDMMCNFNLMWQAPFLPNLLNSTVFLVETSQMISVFFANYKGRPWMKGMLENHPLFLSVFICIAGVVVASWEMVPQLNDAIQLAPFPNDEYRYKVVALVCATIAGTLIWDRLCVWMWGGKVFTAMTEEVSKTTLKDITPVLATAAKIVAVVLVLGTGNILLGGLGYWYYSSWVKKNYPDPDPPAPGPMSQCTIM